MPENIQVSDKLGEVGSEKERIHPDIVEASDKIIGDITTLREGQILLPEFAKIVEKELFIDLDSISSREECIKFIDQVLKNDCYFEGLDYEIFKELIYDLDKLKNNSENKKIRLSSLIKRFPLDRKTKYQNPKIHGKDSAEYMFSQLYDTKEVDGEIINEPVLLNIDEFIASMWNYNIHYGLDIEKINDMINNQKSGRIIIANSLDPVEGKDASILTIVNLGTDFELQTKTGGRLDFKNYKRVFPQIKAGTKIYQKIDRTSGFHGMDISGKEILQSSSKDIVLDDLMEKINSGVKIIEEEGIKFIVSEIDGYVTPLQGKYNSQKVGENEKKLIEVKIDQIKDKVKVTKEIDLGIVGPDTGDISTFGNVKVKGLYSGYLIEANKVDIDGDAGGTILCNNDINIIGSVTGGHTNDGKNISIEGNISVKGNVFLKGYIQALKGLVNLQNIEASIVIGKKIKVKNARKTIFIGENIEVEGNCTDCMFILTDSFSADTLQVKQNNENVIFVIEPSNHEQEFEICSNQINEITKKMEELSKLAEQLTKENKLITNYAIILGKYIENKNSITENEGKVLKSYHQWYKERANKVAINEKQINELNQDIHSITSDLEKLNKNFQKLGELKSKQLIPKINVKLNKGDLNIYHLDFRPYKFIEDFSPEDIKIMTNIQVLLSQKIFNYSLKDTFSSGSVSWQYK